MGWRVFVLKSKLESENLLSISINVGNLWWIIFSNILIRLGIGDNGLKLLQFSLSSFLYTGIILVFFVEFRNLPIVKLMLIISLSGFASSFLHFLSIFIGALFGSHVLFVRMLPIICSISSLQVTLRKKVFPFGWPR